MVRLASTALALALGTTIRAQVLWDGGAVNNRWKDKKNWSTDSVPGSTDDVRFDNSLVASLPATIDLQQDQDVRSLTFATGDNFAIAEIMGSRSLDLYSGQITRTATSSGNQSIDISFLDLRANGVFNIGGTGSLTISSVIREDGAGATAVTKSGAGTLVLSGSNTFTANVAVTGGTLQVGADANLGDAANNISLNGGTLATTGSFTVGANRTVTVGGSGGGINVAAGQTLTFGTVGQLAGSGTLTKSGAGTLALTALPTFTDSIVLSAGTLRLSNLSLSLNSLSVTGNSIIDFAGASSLNLTNFTIAAGVTLTITNWINAADYFFAQNWSGAAFNTTGQTPMTQVVFSGFGPNDTRWQSYDKQVTPVPEPSSYGALLLLLSGALVAGRRQRANPATVWPGPGGPGPAARSTWLRAPSPGVRLPRRAA